MYHPKTVSSNRVNRVEEGMVQPAIVPPKTIMVDEVGGEGTKGTVANDVGIIKVCSNTGLG